MWFAVYLYQMGKITGDQFAQAVTRQLSERPLLGQLAVKEGKLTVKQIMQVFAVQADQPQKPFGQIAISLGYLTEKELSDLLRLQSESVAPLTHVMVELGYFTQAELMRELRLAKKSRGSNSDPIPHEQPAAAAV